MIEDFPVTRGREEVDDTLRHLRPDFVDGAEFIKAGAFESREGTELLGQDLGEVDADMTDAEAEEETGEGTGFTLGDSSK